MGTKYGEPAPFYVTLQINDFLLHNCVFDPDIARNIMTERVINQRGLSISQPNTQGGFTRGIIKDLSIAFHACLDAPFTIDVLVIDTLSNWGILLRKDLIDNLTESFQDQGSKAIIPHLEGGFFTLHKEPFRKNPSYLSLLKPPGHWGRLPWGTTPKEKEVSCLGDSDRTTTCYAHLVFTCLWLLGKYKLCDNMIHIAP
jgi:hypothetical protein